MQNPPRQQKSRRSRSRPKPWALWFVLIAVFSVAIGITGVTVWMNSFLRSEAFRELINARTTDFLKAETKISPLSWEGWAVYAETAQSDGNRETFFSTVTARGLRADVDIGAVLDGAWRVSDVQLRSLEVRFPTPQSLQRDVPFLPGAGLPTSKKSSGFLPNRFELKQVNVEAATARWEFNPTLEGSISESKLTLRPTQQGIEIDARQGKIHHAGMPDFVLQSFRGRYQKQELFVTEALFRLPEGGGIRVTGEASFHGDEKFALQAELDKLSVTPFLPEDWRARLYGGIKGEIEIWGNPTEPDSIEMRGTCHLLEGRLEALPFLNGLSQYLKTEEFRSMSIQRGKAEFTFAKQELRVSKFELESAGLFKARGALTVSKEGQLRGLCEVGVSARTLQWLPAAHAKIFQKQQEGYIWTIVELGGTSAHPQENLTSRLLQATASEVLDKTTKALELPENVSEKAVDVLKEATSTALDFLGR